MCTRRPGIDFEAIRINIANRIETRFGREFCCLGRTEKLVKADRKVGTYGRETPLKIDGATAAVVRSSGSASFYRHFRFPILQFSILLLYVYQIPNIIYIYTKILRPIITLTSYRACIEMFNLNGL